MKPYRVSHRAINVILILLCLAGVVLAAVLIGTTLQEAGSYAGLRESAKIASSEALATDGTSYDENSIDWALLRDENKDIAAWITVDGTSIDYPVVAPQTRAGQTYYLHHDFWHKASFAGCPYVDSRTTDDATHVLVYGHHLSLSDQMFSQLSNVYKQFRFDEIGDATCSTPDKGTTVFRPAFALSEDMDYPDIQNFEFKDEEELHSWLDVLAKQARAKSDTCDNEIAQAKRVLTLVTCSSNFSGQRARTLVVFVC